MVVECRLVDSIISFNGWLSNCWSRLCHIMLVDIILLEWLISYCTGLREGYRGASWSAMLLSVACCLSTGQLTAHSCWRWAPPRLPPQTRAPSLTGSPARPSLCSSVSPSAAARRQRGVPSEHRTTARSKRKEERDGLVKQVPGFNVGLLPGENRDGGAT